MVAWTVVTRAVPRVASRVGLWAVRGRQETKKRAKGEEERGRRGKKKEREEEGGGEGGGEVGC